MYSVPLQPLSAGGVMKAVEDGLIDLDAPLSQYLPEWGNAKVFVNNSNTPDGQYQTEPMLKPITIRSLLLHTSGTTTTTTTMMRAKGNRLVVD